MELSQLLDLLSGVRQTGTGYMAQCPSHPDEKASLHITQNGRGIAVKCHAGCDTEQILKDIDLEFDDLFFDPQTNGVHREIVATYDYKDEHGRLLYQVVRYMPKEFRQRRPDGNSGWTWNVKNVRRVPYMLTEIMEAKDSPVFIVEGEKDVHLLRVHGYIATTNAGGAGKWQEDWTPIFKGRKVYLIPDNDDPGYAHMEKVGGWLSEVAEVRWITLPAKDTSDFLAAHPIEDFHQMIQQSIPFGMQDQKEEEDEEEEVEFPLAPIYEGLLGQIVRLIEPHSEGDPVGIFMELLVAFGNCLGKGPHYLVGATKHHANLFIAICGTTSIGRKGSAHDWMKKVFEFIDPNYVNTCFFGGLASGEGLIHAVRDPKTRTKKDGTPEVLDDGVSDKRKLFFEPELAGRTFTAMAREGSTLSAILREAWDGGNLVVATKTNDDRSTNPHISVVGHATFKELYSTFRSQDVQGGTANRFLYFGVNRSKELPFPTQPDPMSLNRLIGQLTHALCEGRKLSSVPLAEDAREPWKALYHGINVELEKGDSAVLPFVARGPAQILRMALILAIIQGEKEITKEALEQAVGLFEYARKSVEYMLGSNTAFMNADEERLYKFVDKHPGMMSSEIKKQLHWSGGKVPQVAGRLIGRKMMFSEKDDRKNKGPGRPSIRYFTS